MKFNDKESSMREYLGNIFKQSELKHTLVSLKEFEGLLNEAGHSKEETDEFVFKILTYIFVTRYNLADFFKMKDKNAKN